MHRRWKLVMCAAWLACGASGCGDSTTLPTAAAPPHAAVGRIVLSPATFELDVPEAPPTGPIEQRVTATVFDVHGVLIPNYPLYWYTNNAGVAGVLPAPNDPEHATVSPGGSGTTTIGAGDLISGVRSQATVTTSGANGVNQLLGVSSYLASVTTSDGRTGTLESGGLPVGSAPAPVVKPFAVSTFPGQTVTLEVTVAPDTTHILIGAIGSGYYDFTVSPTSSVAGSQPGVGQSYDFKLSIPSSIPGLEFGPFYAGAAVVAHDDAGIFTEPGGSRITVNPLQSPQGRSIR